MKNDYLGVPGGKILRRIQNSNVTAAVIHFPVLLLTLITDLLSVYMSNAGFLPDIGAFAHRHNSH